jgi:hypothetical protein
MSGKFINKSYVNTIDALTTGTIEKVKNANYVFNNLPPVMCDWLNINKDVTTMDEGTGAEYSTIGPNSPIRYNLIKDAIFYSNNIKIEIDLEYDEDGLVSSPPSFGGVILPNTWIPYSGDHVILKQAGKEYIYKVTSVTYDTIDNNNNVYKFEAKLDNAGESYIFNQIEETYRMVINNVGTSFKPILKETVYDCIDSLDGILVQLKNYYISLFYNDSVQTFTYKGAYGNLYDPFMIEFMHRNNILAGADEYIFVNHEVPMPRTFAIDYNESIFRALETKTINNFSNRSFCAELITGQYNLFFSVAEQYFMLKPKDVGMSLFSPFNALLINNVKCHELLEPNDPYSYYNIIVKYFNNDKLDSSIIPLIERIEFKPTVDLFYSIPMIIFCLENMIKNLMS